MKDEELEKMAQQFTVDLGWDNREWGWKEKDQNDAEVYLKVLEALRTVRDSSRADFVRLSDEELKEVADKAFEAEYDEKGSGLLNKPYENFPYHQGFEIGYRAAEARLTGDSK